MESYYEINVALNGSHFFATAPRSARSKADLEKILAAFKDKFPKSEGYEISARYWECRGFGIDINK